MSAAASVAGNNSPGIGIGGQAGGQGQGGVQQVKQIRFVNNEGQPPAKRRRINAACRTCRKRKTRCDGKRPLCSTCTDNGHECMGYADSAEGGVGVGGVKKEGKDGGGLEKSRGEDVDTGEERDRHIVIGNESMRDISRTHSNHSPDLTRPSPKPQTNYFEPKPQPLPRQILQHGRTSSNFADYRDTTVFSDEGPSPAERSPPLHTESHRVPYFRYFGPTAIVPGFKQMVVSVREHRRSTGAGSSVATVSPGSSGYGGGSVYGGNSQTGTEPRSSIDMPIYDQNDPLPVSRLIIHLVETFFAHLGCNYPFLRPKSFMQRVEEKTVEPILVDAVCALAARFSDHPLLTGSFDTSYPKSEYGHVFAQRAKAAVVDTFPCPTVAAVQACLLLAYEGFGSNQDSALWMYLGCAIRMAVDLGLQKLDGVKHQGPKDPGYRRMSNDMLQSNHSTTISAEEREEVEQERIDTLWAVFMLDRVISSGTGRPVTLRDDDFELAFPSVSNTEGGWPNPFPALIQIIHLYGRVSDLLNNIRDVKDVTPKKIDGLSAMEKDLTQFYQKLDMRLTFNAANFQHYVKSGEGTNFILVHFWFHTLIMLVHQPTLMHSFEGQILQLLPNSRELSMSSAKTIADILAFAELIDPRSFIGNPFTSQPIYIAACAFLMESAAHTSSNPTSRDISPPHHGQSRNLPLKDITANGKSSQQKQKHSLLASAANQNYQQCYKALQQLETYWAGTRYILVALDQKAKGIWDPETYTEQEYESTKIRNDMIPGWRRKLSLPSPNNRLSGLRSPRLDIPGSPSQAAIGWSLTGTTNSPSSNLTFMYRDLGGDGHSTQSQPQSHPQHQQQVQAPAPPIGNMIYDPIRSSLPEATNASTTTSSYQQRYPNFGTGQMPPPSTHTGSGGKYSNISGQVEAASTSDAEMLLGLQNSPFSHQHQNHTQQPSNSPFPQTQNINQEQRGYEFFVGGNGNGNGAGNGTGNEGSGIGGLGGVLGGGFLGMGGDMMMESQEIDMSALGGDMMPYLEYLPQDLLSFFEGSGNTGGNGGGGMVGAGGGLG